MEVRSVERLESLLMSFCAAQVLRRELAMENSQGSHEASGVVVDDPDQHNDEGATLAATLDGGSASSSWYWTSMLNFSQSGSSSTYTSAGQLQAAPTVQFTGAASNVVMSPPSSSSMHHVDHNPAALEMLTTTENNTAAALSAGNDPENAVWGQEFLTGPIISEGKPSMHACSDDGLQELLYPRTVRELLFSDQLKLPDPSPSSWELLHQVACAKSFGFPLGPIDEHQLQTSTAGLGVHPDNMKSPHGQQGQQLLHYSHDDRLSSSTASSTLSDNTQPLQACDQPWTVAPSPCDHAPAGAARTCSSMHPSLLQQQFDQARVKQEFAGDNNEKVGFTRSGSSIMNPFLLQHQQQQQNLRLMNDPAACSMLNEANLIEGSCNTQKPNISKLSWPPSSGGAPASLQLPRSPSTSFEHVGLRSPAGAPHLPLHQNQLHDVNAGFPAFSQTPALTFHPDQQFMQQAVLQHHRTHQGAMLSSTIQNNMQYINRLQFGEKARSHIEGGQIEEAKDKGDQQKACNIPHEKQLSEPYNFKRPRMEQQQQQSSTPAAGTTASSFKSQPVRKEKLGERITTLQQLVSPFGKTDTASVLLEAIGYIKFLQDQVQTLSSPYLKGTNNAAGQSGEKNQNAEDAKPDLRSKGLCLVPLSCTMQVANDNGADYWYGGAFR